MEIKYTPEKNNETKINHSAGVEYITFPALERYPELYHSFSTRIGGVSDGMFRFMNLGRMEMDSRAAVFENYRLFCNATGISVEDIVLSDQQHTDNIRVVSSEDRGKGLIAERDYEAIDGLITNEKNAALTLIFADCVPVYLYDPVNAAIGLVHSGWKGTAKKISAKAVRMMGENYGSRPEDMIAVIAPSICKDCYQVSADLYEAFSKTFAKEDLLRIFTPDDNVSANTASGARGTDPSVVAAEQKYLLDLWLAVRITLENAGLKPQNIHTTDICTCCNSDYLFSHRASKGQRGNLAAVMMLK